MKTISIKHYLLCYLALLALLALTLCLSYFSLGPWALAVSMTIATLKAYLILMYFMHVARGPGHWPVILALLFFLIGISILMYTDFFLRIS